MATQPQPTGDDEDGELSRVLQRFQKIAEQGRARETAEGCAEPPAPGKVVQLPLWPKAAPGAPNPVLRSALFAAIKSKDRRFLNNEVIATVDGQQIKFKGEQLNQEDLEVWLQVLDLARDHHLGDRCHTSAYGLLKALGKTTGNHDHKQLDACLTRLVQPVKITQGRFTFTGGLVTQVWKDENSRQYVICVNPPMAGLFGRGWTQLDTTTRRKLRSKALALWLQAHYATHRDPYPYTVSKLRELSGSRTATLFHFRQSLRRALADLQATGAVAAWEINPGDLVAVLLTPSC